uniref:Uncharacterized protein n=1 Tax=Magallana gigas TaxID=29159 RepID=A0A8W8MRP6_MAGGI
MEKSKESFSEKKTTHQVCGVGTRSKETDNVHSETGVDDISLADLQKEDKEICLKARKKFSTKGKIRKKYMLEGSKENLLCHYQFSRQSAKDHLYILLGFLHARRFVDLRVYSVRRQRRERRKYEELSGQSPSGRKETRRSSTLS